jgi:hypothetical protein
MTHVLAQKKSLPGTLRLSPDAPDDLASAFTRFLYRYTNQDYETEISHKQERQSINPGTFRQVLFGTHPHDFGFDPRYASSEDRGGSPDLVVEYTLAQIAETYKKRGATPPCTLIYATAQGGHQTESVILSMKESVYLPPSADTRADFERRFGPTGSHRITRLPQLLCIRPHSNNISHELDLAPYCTTAMPHTRYRVLSIIYQSNNNALTVSHALTFTRYQDRWFLCSDGLITGITGAAQGRCPPGMKGAVHKENIVRFDQLKTYFSYFNEWVPNISKVPLVVYEQIQEQQPAQK